MNARDLILPVRTRSQYRAYLQRQNALQANSEAAATTPTESTSQPLKGENLTPLVDGEATETDLVYYKCSICLESCLGKEPTGAACGHIFCGLCIYVHMTLNPYDRDCPNCKTFIAASSLLRIYP